MFRKIRETYRSIVGPKITWYNEGEHDVRPRCSGCKKAPVGERETTYCECEYCEGHGGGYVFDCGCNAGVDVPDMMDTINRFRSEVLDAHIRAGKEKTSGAAATKIQIRPGVEYDSQRYERAES